MQFSAGLGANPGPAFWKGLAYRPQGRPAVPVDAGCLNMVFRVEPPARAGGVLTATKV